MTAPLGMTRSASTRWSCCRTRRLVRHRSRAGPERRRRGNVERPVAVSWPATRCPPFTPSSRKRPGAPSTTTTCTVRTYLDVAEGVDGRSPGCSPTCSGDEHDRLRRGDRSDAPRSSSDVRAWAAAAASEVMSAGPADKTPDDSACLRHGLWITEQAMAEVQAGSCPAPRQTDLRRPSCTRVRARRRGQRARPDLAVKPNHQRPTCVDGARRHRLPLLAPSGRWPRATSCGGHRSSCTGLPLGLRPHLGRRKGPDSTQQAQHARWVEIDAAVRESCGRSPASILTAVARDGVGGDHRGWRTLPRSRPRSRERQVALRRDRLGDGYDRRQVLPPARSS